MKKFEYQILEDKGNWKQPILDQMQALGAEGWELVSVQSWPNLTEYYYKREVIVPKSKARQYWEVFLEVAEVLYWLALVVLVYILIF
jgi:hypothetical protein